MPIFKQLRRSWYTDTDPLLITIAKAVRWTLEEGVTNLDSDRWREAVTHFLGGAFGNMPEGRDAIQRALGRPERWALVNLQSSGPALMGRQILSWLNYPGTHSWARGFESPHREAQAGVHLAWGRSDCWAIIKKCLVITCQLWLGWCGPLVLLAFTAFLCALRACLEECFVFTHLKAMPDQRPKTVEEVRKQKKEQNKSQRN